MLSVENIFSTIVISLEKLWDKDALIISVIFAVLIVESIAILMKRSMKQRIWAIRTDVALDTENPEYYLEYYRKGQLVDIVRVATIFVALGVLLVTWTTIGANFFIVTAAALVVTFRDFILSIVAFFIILRRYKIGETIAIGDTQGQIISIRMFTIGILGKDSDGDNTGRHFTIPSHRFLTETIRREELQVESIRKELVRIPYDHETYSLSFTEFIDGLRGELDIICSTMTKKNCGNFQTYIGYKYKMDIDYLEDKCIIITIGLVGKWRRNIERKQLIIAWAEQYRVRKIRLEK